MLFFLPCCGCWDWLQLVKEEEQCLCDLLCMPHAALCCHSAKTKVRKRTQKKKERKKNTWSNGAEGSSILFKLSSATSKLPFSMAQCKTCWAVFFCWIICWKRSWCLNSNRRSRGVFPSFKVRKRKEKKKKKVTLSLVLGLAPWETNSNARREWPLWQTLCNSVAPSCGSVGFLFWIVQKIKKNKRKRKVVYRIHGWQIHLGRWQNRFCASEIKTRKPMNENVSSSPCSAALQNHFRAWEESFSTPHPFL